MTEVSIRQFKDEAYKDTSYYGKQQFLLTKIKIVCVSL